MYFQGNIKIITENLQTIKKCTIKKIRNWVKNNNRNKDSR